MCILFAAVSKFFQADTAVELRIHRAVALVQRRSMLDTEAPGKWPNGGEKFDKNSVKMLLAASLAPFNLLKAAEEIEKTVVFESAVEMILDSTVRNRAGTCDRVPLTERALQFVGP